MPPPGNRGKLRRIGGELRPFCTLGSRNQLRRGRMSFLGGAELEWFGKVFSREKAVMRAASGLCSLWKGCDATEVVLIAVQTLKMMTGSGRNKTSKIQKCLGPAAERSSDWEGIRRKAPGSCTRLGQVRPCQSQKRRQSDPFAGHRCARLCEQSGQSEHSKCAVTSVLSQFSANVGLSSRP
jgi:hypothetical protein